MSKLRLLNIILVLLIILVACDVPPNPTPKYKIGNFVVTKLGSYNGQIYDVKCHYNRNECWYLLRIDTKTHGLTENLLGEHELRSPEE